MPAETKPTPRLTRTTPAPKTGIVHLGLGAFFRAHGAIYTEEAMQASGGDWGIIGVSLQSPATRDALAPQGGSYTALELGPEGARPRRVEVISAVLVAPENPQAVLDALADPAVKIVSLTVTEKGYCHEPSSGALNRTHPDIAHDITQPLPRSAPGFLVRALLGGRKGGLAPFTAMSLDNLPHNGAVLRGVVLALAQEIDPALAAWIAAEGRFPASMVDRIVPATKPEDITRVTALTGLHDAAPVAHEPFRQWVIEESFVGGARPDWAAAGAQMVADVTPHEHMKLRMLNGTHSALAYLGYLAGHETIAATMADPVFAGFAERLWRDEIIPVLQPPPGADLAAYAQALARRYANPAIAHRTWQIAMDGSQKLPQRILATLAETFATGRAAPPGLVLAVAGWMRYVGGVDEQGAAIEVKDPLAAQLRAASEAAGGAAAKVAALLAQGAIFSPAMAAALQAPVTAAYARLLALGARGAIQEIS